MKSVNQTLHFKFDSLSNILLVFLLALLFSQCRPTTNGNENNNMPTEDNKAVSDSQEAISSIQTPACFTIQCIDAKTIRVTSLDCIVSSNPPSSYAYNLSLIGVFRSGMMGQDAGTSISVDWSSATGLTQPSMGTPITKIGVGSNIGTLASSFGNPDYGLNFTVIPNNPGLIPDTDIGGQLDITVSMPAGLNVLDIIKDCDTTGDAVWGLPGNDPKIIGKYKILCPIPCCVDN